MMVVITVFQCFCRGTDIWSQLLFRFTDVMYHFLHEAVLKPTRENFYLPLVPCIFLRHPNLLYILIKFP